MPQHYPLDQIAIALAAAAAGIFLSIYIETNSKPPQSSFMSLPAEIRQRILFWAVTPEKFRLFYRDESPEWTTSKALLRVSKTTKEDMHYVFVEKWRDIAVLERPDLKPWQLAEKIDGMQTGRGMIEREGMVPRPSLPIPPWELWVE